jgi:uncharacterized protein (UPF0335 family)
MTEEVKKTKVELVDAMQKLYTEISSLTEQIDEIKAEAKERDMPAALMAKVAQLRANAKVDSVLEKNAEFEELVNEVRGY